MAALTSLPSSRFLSVWLSKWQGEECCHKFVLSDTSFYWSHVEFVVDIPTRGYVGVCCDVLHLQDTHTLCLWSSDTQTHKRYFTCTNGHLVGSCKCCSRCSGVILQKELPWEWRTNEAWVVGRWFDEFLMPVPCSLSLSLTGLFQLSLTDWDIADKII